MLFPIRDVIDAAKGDAETELEIRRGMAELADEMNSRLAGHEVRVIHLDTEDYLEMIPRENEDEDE